MVAWLATSPLSSQIRTPLCSQNPGTEGGEAAEMEGQTWSRRMDKGRERGNKVGGEGDEGRQREAQILFRPQLLDATNMYMWI